MMPDGLKLPCRLRGCSLIQMMSDRKRHLRSSLRKGVSSAAVNELVIVQGASLLRSYHGWRFRRTPFNHRSHMSNATLVLENNGD
jgi:hypothetical protein